ncbi:hypothetical protein COO60DRAFT_1502047 [Scenedesmus sp. NREL 46B-D3]|nr:hypothetical protein COO60DRAFT_1502047 [Scenedesmus sp. NREL 46B-D3]
MLSLTGAARPITSSPGHGSSQGQGAGAAAAADGRLAKGPGLRFPEVCIVFAAVEDAAQLSGHPALASSVHGAVHRMMLQLLRCFPGSYLIRAQAGELRYLAAFTTPTAAAAWCLTVQEASLYLPYPLELLGFPSFGVQLDVGGRLVFRGPRFKMGLAEGVPTCILPDHLGRADYHAGFVNRAARYADAAAHGGQVVTDTALAAGILQHWRSSSSSSSGIIGSSSKPLSSSDAAAAAAPAGAADEADPAPAQAAADAPAAGAAAVPVECSWLGSFMFKGSPKPVEMVCFGPVVLAGRQYPAAPPSGKGARVLQRVGVMEQVAVQLPAAVRGVWAC